VNTLLLNDATEIPVWANVWWASAMCSRVILNGVGSVYESFLRRLLRFVADSSDARYCLPSNES